MRSGYPTSKTKRARRCWLAAITVTRQKTCPGVLQRRSAGLTDDEKPTFCPEHDARLMTFGEEEDSWLYALGLMRDEAQPGSMPVPA